MGVEALLRVSTSTPSRPCCIPPDDTERLAFDFDGRNRRPPRDPVNALLPFATPCSTLLPPAPVRPAGAALDLMEEFLPLIVDSVVLGAVNMGAIKRSDFDQVLVIDLGPVDGRASICVSSIGRAYANPERAVVIV